MRECSLIGCFVNHWLYRGGDLVTNRFSAQSGFHVLSSSACKLAGEAQALHYTENILFLQLCWKDVVSHVSSDTKVLMMMNQSPGERVQRCVPCISPPHPMKSVQVWEWGRGLLTLPCGNPGHCFFLSYFLKFLANFFKYRILFFNSWQNPGT